MQRENSILPTIRCKNNESLPKEGNDETENIRDNNYEVNWDGLHSRNMLETSLFNVDKEKSPTNRNQPLKKIPSNKSGARAAPLSTY